ncbi:hypothetical protein CLHOM_09060 [Clostridium homopropionicum DSM 5847]|uniref:Uncharacterized protein n=1 Tax=Clostridium homopropionicum DSM 5847 TaxID=1121318 RepID=A0A0L6ZCR0_9CLOT|nr:hypothetical protein CLHOM_09060 [Clostridium homopropionicum DSM 5847]
MEGGPLSRRSEKTLKFNSNIEEISLNLKVDN